MPTRVRLSDSSAIRASILALIAMALPSIAQPLAAQDEHTGLYTINFYKLEPPRPTLENINHHGESYVNIPFELEIEAYNEAVNRALQEYKRKFAEPLAQGWSGNLHGGVDCDVLVDRLYPILLKEIETVMDKHRVLIDEINLGTMTKNYLYLNHHYIAFFDKNDEMIFFIDPWRAEYYNQLTPADQDPNIAWHGYETRTIYTENMKNHSIEHEKEQIKNRLLIHQMAEEQRQSEIAPEN